MNISRKAYLNETSFLLKDVIKIGTLTCAESFSHQTIDNFLEILGKAYDFADTELKSVNRIGDLMGTKLYHGQTAASAEFKKVWEKMVEQSWLKVCLPSVSGGLGFPEVVGSVITEIFLAFNPAFALYYIVSKESANLIEQYGSPKIKKEFGEKLVDGRWSGALSHFEKNELIAIPQGDHFAIRGAAFGLVCGGHAVTDNIIQILPAKIRSEEKHAHGLFVIPNALESDGKCIDNHVRLAKRHHSLGIKGVSIDDFEYGIDGICQGYLLTNYDPSESFFLHPSLRFLHGAAMLGPAKLTNIFSLSNSDLLTTSQEAMENLAGEPPGPTAFNISLKSLFSGLRGALYTASFFGDCGEHGGESQKRRFIELYRLYVPILKVYAQKKALHHYLMGFDLIGINGYINENTFEQNLRDLLSGSFIGGSNSSIVQRFMCTIRDESNLFVQNLVEEFKQIDPYAARTEAMRFVIGTWQEYVGGLILLHDDCVRDKDEKNWRPHSERLLMFLGDLMVCYHLIRQGLEAEKKMEIMGANFFNLESEIGKDLEIRELYNKILLAVHFAQTELPLQEGHIKIMQEKVK